MLWRDWFETADRLSSALHILGINALPPSIALELKRAAIREMTHRHRAANPRMFGSTLRGADREDGDLDLLVDALPGATLFDLGRSRTGRTPGAARRARRPEDPRRSSRQIPRPGVGRGAAGMTEPRLNDCLDHIRQAAKDACGFIDGLDHDAFMADKRTQQAVVMSPLTIGEAATKIMDLHKSFAERRPDISWQAMRGMRNRIAHGYFDINLETGWSTVTTALPELLASLKRANGIEGGLDT